MLSITSQFQNCGRDNKYLLAKAHREITKNNNRSFYTYVLKHIKFMMKNLKF